MYIVYSLEILVFLYSIYGLNVILHGMGIFLMVRLQKSSRGRSNQEIFLINLAVGDLLKNVVNIVGVVTYSRLHEGSNHLFWSEVHTFFLFLG